MKKQAIMASACVSTTAHDNHLFRIYQYAYTDASVLASASSPLPMPSATTMVYPLLPRRVTKEDNKDWLLVFLKLKTKNIAVRGICIVDSSQPGHTTTGGAIQGHKSYLCDSRDDELMAWGCAEFKKTSDLEGSLYSGGLYC